MCRIFAESRRSESNSADLSRVAESLIENIFITQMSRGEIFLTRHNPRFHRHSLHYAARLFRPPRANDRRCRADRAKDLPPQRAATPLRRGRAAPARARAKNGTQCRAL